MLYLVATPIGNLEDITKRALRVLSEVRMIAAEDTRQTRKLLTHYGIRTELTSYNDLEKERKTRHLVAMMLEGKDIAMVSDAGTPGVSDPGFYLVRECLKAGIQVSPVPGATAAISALICSGLPTDKFYFAGFLSKKDKKRRDEIASLGEREETVIIYESPYRLLDTLKDMAELLGSHEVVVGRELTKMFEEFVRGNASDVLKHFEEKGVKGEIVILIKNTDKKKDRKRREPREKANSE